MSDDIVERLRKIAEQYKCPWGEPGSNPDYFSQEDYRSVHEAADEIERLKTVLKGIEVYSSSHDDAKAMAFRALESQP